MRVWMVVSVEEVERPEPVQQEIAEAVDKAAGVKVDGHNAASAEEAIERTADIERKGEA
jgi:hypothetical protein